MNIRKWNIKWELIDGYELLILSGYPTDEDTEPWDEHVRLLWKYLKDEDLLEGMMPNRIIQCLNLYLNDYQK
jgi:hypothetical protein